MGITQSIVDWENSRKEQQQQQQQHNEEVRLHGDTTERQDNDAQSNAENSTHQSSSWIESWFGGNNRSNNSHQGTGKGREKNNADGAVGSKDWAKVRSIFTNSELMAYRFLWSYLGKHSIHTDDTRKGSAFSIHEDVFRELILGEEANWNSASLDCILATLYHSLQKLYSVFVGFRPNGDIRSLWLNANTKHEKTLFSDMILTSLAVYQFDRPLPERLISLAEASCELLRNTKRPGRAQPTIENEWECRLVLIFLSLVMTNDNGDESSSEDNDPFSINIEKLVLVVQGIFTLWNHSVFDQGKTPDSSTSTVHVLPSTEDSDSVYIADYIRRSFANIQNKPWKPNDDSNTYVSVDQFIKWSRLYGNRLFISLGVLLNSRFLSGEVSPDKKTSPFTVSPKELYEQANYVTFDPKLSILDRPQQFLLSIKLRTNQTSALPQSPIVKCPEEATGQKSSNSEAWAWDQLYKASRDGSSMNRFSSHVVHYPDPTLVITKAQWIEPIQYSRAALVPTLPDSRVPEWIFPLQKEGVEKQEVTIAAYVDQPWKDSKLHGFGGKDSFIAIVNPFFMILTTKPGVNTPCVFSHKTFGLFFGSKSPAQSSSASSHGGGSSSGGGGCGSSFSSPTSMAMKKRQSTMSIKSSAMSSSSPTFYNQLEHGMLSVDPNFDRVLFYNDPLSTPPHPTYNFLDKSHSFSVEMELQEMEVYGIGAVDSKQKQSVRQKFDEDEAERRSRVNLFGNQFRNSGGGSLTEDEIKGQRALLDMAGITSKSYNN
ncbi:Restriction of telomere capping protein 5 [Mycoemilia scoparia]|uniref:Restriction of telomere capping protein 5 n=1 Tax=Mycoemilia scoparia TaxID=417184 RepID=A0A9W8DUJ2_9FUNG|nr:Restriction of telomere capping protein 5 [Mycoemilia scoparia]